MTFLQLHDKIGKQPIKNIKAKDAIIFVDGKEYVITNIIYKEGEIIGLNTMKYCEYQQSKNKNNTSY